VGYTGRQDTLAYAVGATSRNVPGPVQFAKPGGTPW
jgi:hypothetical protein